MKACLPRLDGSHRRDQRAGGLASGFSLTELLVVLGIIIVLVGLLLPMIEGARRMARSTHCLSNMKQIGTALHAYMASEVNFPPSGHGGFSPQARLLRYVQKDAVSAKINWGIHAEHQDQSEAARMPIEYYRCPSDPAKRGINPAACSYRASAGVLYSWAPPGEDAIAWKREGVFTPGWDIELEDIRDGAAVTVAFSEHGLGDHNDHRVTPQSDYYEIKPGDNATADDVRELLLKVNPSDRSKNAFSGAGTGWIATKMEYTLYSHDALPGELSAQVPPQDPEFPPYYVSTAKSYHGDGANILLCDGAARWVKKEIDPVTWRSLATFQGGEKVSSS